MGLFDGFPGQQMGNYAAPLMQGQAPQQPYSSTDGTNLGSALTQLQQMPMNANGLPQIMQPPMAVPTTPAQMPGQPAQPMPQVGTGTFATNGTAPAQPAPMPETAMGGTFARPIFPRA